jgi:hypothetical protein
LARKLTLDGNLFDPPRGGAVFRWNGKEFLTLTDVRKGLGLEQSGTVEHIPFNPSLVESRTRSSRLERTIDRAIATSKVGDDVTIPVNGRTSIRDDRVQVFDLANRFVTLSLPDERVRHSIESAITSYPLSEPVLVKVRLTKIAPATDLRAAALGLDR